MQNIPIGKSGSTAMRVLEALTPVIGTTAPAAHATYIGQIYINTTAVPPTVYVSVKTNAVAPADDWKQITLA
jgi:hypothetical protein